MAAMKKSPVRPGGAAPLAEPRYVKSFPGPAAKKFRHAFLQLLPQQSQTSGLVMNAA
jgi:hypothetical protein